MAKIVLFTWFFFGIVKQICHRDLKLENTLLDGSTAPRVKICDFGYSKVLLEPSLLWLLVCCLIAVIFLIYIMQHDNWYDHSVLYCSGLLTVKKRLLVLPLPDLLSCCFLNSFYSHLFCIHNQNPLWELQHTLLLKFSWTNTMARYSPFHPLGALSCPLTYAATSRCQLMPFARQ